jgi:hypothetical protein
VMQPPQAWGFARSQSVWQLLCSHYEISTTCSPAMVPENSCLMICWNSRVEWCSKCKFSPQGWLRVYYRTLGEQRQRILPTSSSNLQNKFPLSCAPNSTVWLSSTRLRISKIK